MAVSRLIPLMRKGTRPACVMIPGAGGGLNPYLPLASSLGGTYNVHGIRATGLVPGEEPEDDVAKMADSIVAELAAAAATPDLVFGWSLGGTLAWEVAVRLENRPAVIIVDSSPLPREATVKEDADVRATILGGLGPRPRADAVDRVAAVIAAQMAALAVHETCRRYDGQVLVLMCAGDDRTGRAAMVERWRSLSADFRYAELDAGHFGVFEPEHLPQLVDAITEFTRLKNEVGG